MSGVPVKSADRVLALIELLGLSGRELSHSDLAIAMSIPKSSLSKLLKNLIARQWLSYDQARRTYRIGPIVAELVRRTSSPINLIEAVAPLLETLTRATRETSAFNIRRGDEAEVAWTEMSPMRLLSMMQKGDRAPLYATSSGKIILAHFDDAALGDYLERVAYVSFTDRTLRSHAQLRRELDEARITGVARSISEFTLGVVGIACPIVSPDGGCAGSISIAMPAARYSPAAEAAILPQIRACVESLLLRIRGADEQK